MRSEKFERADLSLIWMDLARFACIPKSHMTTTTDQWIQDSGHDIVTATCMNLDPKSISEGHRRNCGP
jgi:hypothetical protein